MCTTYTAAASDDIDSRDDRGGGAMEADPYVASNHMHYVSCDQWWWDYLYIGCTDKSKKFKMLYNTLIY